MVGERIGWTELGSGGRKDGCIGGPDHVNMGVGKVIAGVKVVAETLKEDDEREGEGTWLVEGIDAGLIEDEETVTVDASDDGVEVVDEASGILGIWIL